MNGDVFLPNLEVLEIYEGNTLYYGGNQEWFSDSWKRRAGCGPTSFANLICYLSKTHAGYEALCPYDTTGKSGFVQLMENSWRFVTPGSKGVNTTDIFSDGAKGYGDEKGVALMAESLVVAPLHSGTRSYKDISGFVVQALKRRLPVAFLNLSNGILNNLDSWHWVTIVALRGGDALIYDQSKAKWINFQLWLSTSIMGGGFVTIEPFDRTATG